MLLIGFVICAYIDWKQKMLPDALIALLWGVCFFMPVGMHSWLVGLFALSVFVNSVPKQPFFGWGDLLLFPVWFVAIWGSGEIMMGMLFGGPAYLMRFVLAPERDKWFVDRIAVAPFFAITYFIALLFSLVR
jgi:hypothetical protein